MKTHGTRFCEKQRENDAECSNVSFVSVFRHAAWLADSYRCMAVSEGRRTLRSSPTRSCD